MREVQVDIYIYDRHSMFFMTHIGPVNEKIRFSGGINVTTRPDAHRQLAATEVPAPTSKSQNPLMHGSEAQMRFIRPDDSDATRISIIKKRGYSLRMSSM